MILDLIQTRSNLYSEYVFMRSGIQLAKAKTPFKLVGATINVDIMERMKYVLSLDFSEDAKGTFRKTAKRKIRPFYILDDAKNPVGYICGRMTKFIFGTFYYEIFFNGHSFTAYEIGLGKDGLFIDIFEGEKQICSARKENITYDNKDVYKLYVSFDRYLDMVVLFMLYYDYYRWGNRGEIVHKKKAAQYVYTLNKEIREKHNPGFIESCDL